MNQNRKAGNKYFIKKGFLKGHINFCLNASNPKCMRFKQNKVILIKYRQSEFIQQLLKEESL